MKFKLSRVALTTMSLLPLLTACEYEGAAFIIPRPGVEIQPEDVRAFCRGKIAWFKVPKYVAMISGFPLTASGKIQKYILREQAAELWPEAMQPKL